MSYRGTTLEVPITFVVEICCNCGMAFAVTNDFQDRRMNDHRTFYCPAGHGQSYSDKSEAEKLRDQLQREKDVQTRLRAENDQAWAAYSEEEKKRRETEREVRRITRRANAGQCLQCKRHFVNVEAHIKRKHPSESPSHLGERAALKSEKRR